MTDKLLATPFHARAAEANRLNVWENRGGFTLAGDYGDAAGEAIAARFAAVLADLSWYWRAAITGRRAAEFVSRCFTRDASLLDPGTALTALWLGDEGGMRGAGTVVRLGRETFQLITTLEDADWLEHAARLYGVAVKDATADQGFLALVGPLAGKILAHAGLDAALEPLALKKRFWRGIEVTLSRFGLGYEIHCEPDNALIVWDRLMSAGRRFALRPAGQCAMDILALESGVLRPGCDFTPARDGFAAAPSPQALGLAALVDRTHLFNGKRGFLAAGTDTVLSGILLESATAEAGVELTADGRSVGRILCSRRSPALRQAIALAVFAVPPPAGGLMAGRTVCRAAALPFLPIPAPIEATETSATDV